MLRRRYTDQHSEMEEGSSWLGGHDWTSVEVASTSSSYSVDGMLFPAEDIIAEGNAVVLVNIDGVGTLLVTNFRILFVLNDGSKQLSALGTIPLATIEKFAKQQPVRAPGPHSRRLSSRRLLQIVGKDMRTIVFGFRPHGKQRRSVYDALLRLTRPARLWDLYAFSSVWAESCAGPDPRLRLRDEYRRIIAENKYWRVSTANSDYMLCPTYPSLLVMPMSLSDEEIQQAAAFRARGRLPTMSWQHQDNGAVLARSSQPMVGIMMNSRSNADEKLVAALCTPFTYSDKRRKLYIADARPRKNALANGAMGGGSESSANYSQCEVVFLGIDNIHAMRDSLARLRDYLDIHGAASSDGSSSLLRSGGTIWGGGNLSSMAAAVSALGDSGWLTHVHNILAGAAWITARIALEGASVLVHCSDGWDRTTQLVSLAELMLDPYYRTLKGFQALIEKDWLAFGHPFADRLGMPTLISNEPLTTSPVRVAPGSSFTNVSTQSSGTASYGSSPIFQQWIDCVAQLLRLYPRAFEFSSAYLVDLVDSVLSCRFGNFLCNTEKERLQAGVAESCACIWTHFKRIQSGEGSDDKHLNLFYDRASDSGALLPPAAALAPTLWPQFYLRWVFPPDRTTSSGDEIENQARMITQMMSHRVSSSEKGRDHAEGRVEELLKTVDDLKNKLLLERRYHASTKAAAARARKEATAIKHAVEALGCKIRFSTAKDISPETLDDDARDPEDIVRTPDTGELSISVSVVSDYDVSANQFRKDCPMSPVGINKDSCSWPQSGCARLGSTLEGLRVNFDALKLPTNDHYFDPEHENSHPSYNCVRTYSPGVT